MKLTIYRIDNGIVICEMEDGSLLDIAKRWFSENIQEGDVLEFEYRRDKQS